MTEPLSPSQRKALAQARSLERLEAAEQKRKQTIASTREAVLETGDIMERTAAKLAQRGFGWADIVVRTGIPNSLAQLLTMGYSRGKPPGRQSAIKRQDKPKLSRLSICLSPSPDESTR